MEQLTRRLVSTREQRRAHELRLLQLEDEESSCTAGLQSLQQAVPGLQEEVEKLQFLLAGIEELAL